jgi:hypothetical protein
MNEHILSIEIQKLDFGAEVAVIKINGCELLDIIKEVEFPIAETAGEASLAGEYAYLPLHVIKAPSNLFLGGAVPTYQEAKNGKRSILECTCG